MLLVMVSHDSTLLRICAVEAGHLREEKRVAQPVLLRSERCPVVARRRSPFIGVVPSQIETATPGSLGSCKRLVRTQPVDSSHDASSGVVDRLEDVAIQFPRLFARKKSPSSEIRQSPCAQSHGPVAACSSAGCSPWVVIDVTTWSAMWPPAT
jgi:hypothetical protein